MIKATEQHKQKTLKRVNKMKLLLHLAEQFVKRVSIAVQAKSDLPRVFLPTSQKYKKTKGWLFYLYSIFLFSSSSDNCHVTSQANWDNLFSKLSAIAMPLQQKGKGRYVNTVVVWWTLQSKLSNLFRNFTHQNVKNFVLLFIGELGFPTFFKICSYFGTHCTTVLGTFSTSSDRTVNLRL